MTKPTRWGCDCEIAGAKAVSAEWADARIKELEETIEQFHEGSLSPRCENERIKELEAENARLRKQYPEECPFRGDEPCPVIIEVEGAEE